MRDRRVKRVISEWGKVIKRLSKVRRARDGGVKRMKVRAE